MNINQIKRRAKVYKHRASNVFWKFAMGFCIFCIGIVFVAAVTPDREYFVKQRIIKEQTRQEVYKEEADKHRESIKELQEQWHGSQEIVKKYETELGLISE